MIGGKALGLAKLRASEIRIPKTYVIPYYVEIKDNEIKNLLDENKKLTLHSFLSNIVNYKMSGG